MDERPESGAMLAEEAERIEKLKTETESLLRKSEATSLMFDDLSTQVTHQIEQQDKVRSDLKEPFTVAMIRRKEGLAGYIDEQIRILKDRSDRYIGLTPYWPLFAAVTILGISYALGGRYILSDAGLGESIYARYAPLFGIVLVAYSLLLFAWSAMLRGVTRRRIEEELRALTAMKAGRIASPPEPTYFDRLVEINVNNLANYYLMVKVHTNYSFLVAISAGCVGFGLILTGLGIGSTDVSNAREIAFISAGSGVIIEFIASVFFVLYNRTTRQLRGYHDHLVKAQDVLLCIKIAEQTNDSASQVAMNKCIIEALTKVPPAMATEARQVDAAG